MGMKVLGWYIDPNDIKTKASLNTCVLWLCQSKLKNLIIYTGVVLKKRCRLAYHLIALISSSSTEHIHDPKPK